MAESSQNQSRIVGDQSKMRSLYEQLNRKVPEYDWGSEEEFMEGMQDEQNREWLHKTLTEKGKYKSSLDHFNNRLGFGMINLDPDSETGTGPVQYKEPQYSQTQVQPQQYETAQAGKQYQAPAQDNMLPRVPQYPMAGMPQQQMPMYEGYQPKQPIQYQQEQPQQPIQTAAPLTEEAGAERGAQIRKSMEEKAQHKQAMYDINKAYGINDELKKMDDQYQQQVDALKQEEGTQMAKDEELKHMQMQQLRQSQAAASYVYELAKDRNKVMLPYTVRAGFTDTNDDLAKYMNLSDDDVASYARMAYGITGKMDADMLAGKRAELQNMLAGQVLDDIVKTRSNILSNDKTAFISQKFRSSLMPDQLFSAAISWFGSDGQRMWRNIENEALAKAENKYDNSTWGGLVTYGAAGAALAYNMMMLGKVMNAGFAGSLGRFSQYGPQAASGLWAPGQAGLRYAVWDSMVNNAYWNGALRGSAALANQYVGFGRLGAINSGIAMLSDPNLVNRYGNLTSVNGWLGELGCDAKKILDAYTEEGYTGAKFGLVNMATAGLATKVKAGIFDKAVKEGKGVYEASSIANHSKRVLGTKALGLGGELGFFTMQDIDRINEENRNNPDGQIGICDYEKWSSVILKQVGFLGALKAVNMSHGHQKDKYQMMEEIGRKRAGMAQEMLDHTKMAKWMLERTKLTLNANDLDELAAAGLGRHKEFSFDLLNNLMHRADGENITVYEKLMREKSLPTTTLYKLKVAMEHQISLMGYTCDNNGRIVGSFAPIDFVTSAVMCPSPRKGGGWRVSSIGRNSEVVEYKTFSSKDDAEYYAGQVNKLAKVNYLRLLETELGDTQTTVKDVLNSYADRNGIGRWDAVELYNEWLNNRENASPLAKEMASEVKDEIWQAVSRNRVQAIAKARQQVKDITGVDVSALVSKDPSTLSKEELDAIDTYNRALWTIKKTATTDPDILAVENSVDPDTGMVRSGVTKDGRQVTVKGSGDAVVVTEKANPAEGKPAGKPEMVSAKDVQITSETPADDLIKEINDRKAAEAQAEQQEQQPKTVAEEPVPAPASEEPVPAPEPVKAVEPEAPADVAPEPVEEPAERIRKVSVFDANTGNEYDGEDVGPGMQAGMRRVRLGNGKMMDVPAEDLTYMAEEPKAAAPAIAEQPKTVAEGVAPVAPEPAPAEEAPVSESGVKLDANTGMPTMENAPENTAAYFASNESKLGEKMNDAVIKQATDRANAAYQSAMKKTPNLGTDMNLRRMQQEQAAIEAEQSRLKQQADYWNAVSEAYQAAKMQAKMKADNEKYMASREDQIKGRALNKRIEKVVGEIGDPSTVREAVLMDFLKPGGFGLSKDDVIKELGSIGENLTAEGLRNQMAKGERKKLDLTIQSIAEGIASEHGWDVQEVRDEIIDVLTRFGGDKVKAVQELEHIADIISGRKGQYTDEQAEQMRQQALADGEDLNAPIEAEAVPEELQPSNEQAPFDIEDRVFDIEEDKKEGPVFYSNASRAVEGIKQERATAEQWLNMIKNGGGMKAGEDKWTGLSKWLESRKGEKITKQEIMDYINDHMIKIDDVEYAENGVGDDEIRKSEEFRKLRAEYKDSYAELWRKYTESAEENPIGPAEELAKKYPKEFWDAFEINTFGVLDIKDEQKAKKYFGRSDYAYRINRTRLHYTTPGLQNKREIALVVPGIDPYNQNDRIHFGDAGDGRAVAWVRFGEYYEGKDEYDLLHSLGVGEIAERPKKVLVIDEIQSKRHQDGREMGYAGDSNEGMVPDAPFDKNWSELALKRMLRYAADNGYDKIVWTTGEQQASRYDLDQTIYGVDRFNNNYYLHLKDGHEIKFQLENGKMNVERDEFGLNGKLLSDVVGKEVADKIEGLGHQDSLNTEDLKVSNEGMRAFYDKMLPSFMNKYGKRFGIKVGETQLPLSVGNGETMHSVDVTPELVESVRQGQPQFDIEKGEGKVPELEGVNGMADKRVVDRAIRKVANDNTLSTEEKAERIDAIRKRWYAIEDERISKAAEACGVDGKFMKRLGNATGSKVVADERFFDYDTENGFYDADTDTIYVNPRGNKMGNLSGILGHETTHGLEGTKGYDELSDVLIELEYGQDGDVSEAIREIQDRYNNHFQNMYELGYHKSLRHLYWEGAKKEVVANVLKNSVFKGAEGAKMLEQAVERMEDQSMAGRFAAKVRDMYDLAQTAWNKGWDEAVSKKELMDARDKFADLAKKRRAENDKNAMQTRVIYDDHGKVIAEVDERNNIQMNLETYDSWRDNLNRPHDGTRKTMEAYLDEKIKTGLMKPEDKQQMLEKMDYWYDYMRKVSDFVDPETGEFKFKAFHEWNAQQPVYRLIGKDVEEKVLSTIVANGEYPVNLELTTDCIKRETFTQLLNEIVRLAPGALQKLNPGEITILQDMMKSYGIQTACPLCFVEGKRLMIRNWAHTISDNWNVALAEAVAENDLLNGWKPKFKTVTEVVEGKKKTRKVVTNLKEMEELLGAFGFASDDAVSAEDWDTVKSRNDVSEQQEFQRRVNSVFDILAGRRGGLLDADMQDIEAASRRAQDRMMEMERNWMMEHVDEPWEMSKAEREEIDGILADGKKVVHDKMKINVSQYPELRKVLHPEDLIGNKGLDNLRSLGDEAHRKLFSNILSSFGAGTPKVVQRAEPYAGEIMDRSMDSAVNKAVKEGGWRLFSFSDYDISKTFDIMQIFWDAEARMAKLQSYSKEVPYILFFGRGTNAKINMSTLVEVRPDATVIERYKKAPNKSSVAGKETKETIRHEVNEYAGLVLNKEGEIIGNNWEDGRTVTKNTGKEGEIIGMTWSNSHSVSPEFAQAIFHDDEYNANCGATTVGVSVNHTLYSMMTPWIRQVIPFHLSGMPIAARNRTDVLWYRDFTSDQNTCVQNDKGKWVKITSDWAEEHIGKLKEFNFYEGEEKEGWDLRKRCEDYVKWCNKNKFRPKFEWALNADNYVKWCKENGYEPNKQIETEMRAHETNGIYDNYYKVIADFNPYKPTFDADGNYTGDVKAPHKPIKGDFTKDQGLLDLMFGAEDSMLANREANIEHGNAMITKMANDAIAFLQGKKTREEIMSKDPDAFRNTEDADLYLRRRRQQWDIEDAEPAGPVRSRNFKRWFGNWDSDPENASKVVNEDGSPKVVHHGTKRYGFTIFETGADWNKDNIGSHFGSKGVAKDFADDDKTYNVYLNIRNPWETYDFFADNFDNAYLDAIKELCDDIEKQDPVKAAEARKRMKEVVLEAYPNITEEQYDRAAKDTFLNEFDDDEGLFADEVIGSENEAPRQKLVMLLRELLEKGGYDGIKYDNWYEGGDSDDTTCWIALRPEQIKSAETEGEMANNGEFDPKNPDLRYDVEPADQPMTAGNAGADDMPEDFVQDAEETRFRKYRELVDAIEKEAANYQRELDWIKNGGTDKGLLTRVRHFVRNRLNLMTGTGLGPAGINNILSQLDQVGEAQDIEPILRQIQYTLNRAELKSEMDEMLRVLNTKTQSQTSRGLVKGIGVDSQTNQVLSDIRGSFRQMVTTDIDERIREVNREIRDLKKEYGIKHVEDGDAEFQSKYREMRDRYTSLLEQRNEAQKAQANETEETLTERHEQILNEMNDYREQGKEIPSTLIEERVALPIRKELAQLRSMTGTMDQIEKELQDARDALIGLRGDERTNQKRLIEDKQANLINWQRRCVLMSKQISDELKDLISEGRSKRQEQIRKQVEEENQLVKIALDAVKKNRITQRNQPAGTKEHEDKEWTSADKMVASLQESWKENKEDRRDFMQKFNAPVYSFNYLLKYLDRNHGQGDGPLYDMLMRSEHGAVEANDAYAEGLVEYGTKVDKKCKEIFGMSLGDLKADSNKRTYKTIVLTEQLGDGTIIQKPVEVTKGQALYIWLMSRQIAGIDKLRDDGWTPDKIQEIEELMGDKYKKLGTWITEEFLPQLRADKYNPTYERLYGTSMHMASHYFPIKIWDKVVHEKGELGEVFEGMPSAATGNLVMRTSNNLPIDTDLNALDVLMDYGRSMERWNAMSELTKNLNVLRHCNAFRNRIVANDGEGMWDIWMDACNLVTNNYQTKSDVMGQMMGKLQNSFMKNAIGYRFYTALKQTLSYPAFSAYTDNLEFQAELMANIGRTFTIGKNGSIWESNYQWAMENLPGFRQRIADGDMGIEGLNDDGIGGSIERYWSKYGMAANKAVDARTVAAGARAVYNYEYKQGKKRGLSDAEAKRLAKINAEICFNESQQSSRPEFSSQMQKNRDLMSRSTVAFQNSNISYRRGVLEGMNDILRANEIYKQNMESVRGSDHEAEYKKQFAADRRKQICRGVRKVLNFGALLPGLWYIGSNLSTLWANNEEDEEKDKYWTNMMANIAMGSLTNGSSAGPLVQGLYNTVYKVVTGESQSTTAEYNPLQSFSLMLEIMTDALKTYKEDSNTDGGIGITGWAEGMANWAFRSMGVNPETWANIVLGLMDSVKRGRPELQDAMFVLNVPGSHRKEIVNRMARKDSPAEYMRQIMEAGKIYEDGDPRYSKLMMGTKIIDDKKRHDLLQDYLNAKYPEFGEELDKINAFEKAVGERAKEIENQLVLDGETKHSTLIRMEALNDVIESGKYDISAEAYKRIANSPLHKEDGRLDICEEMTAQGRKLHRQTLKSKYDRLRKECDKAAANAEKDPETLNAKVKELMEVETKIMIELGK